LDLTPNRNCDQPALWPTVILRGVANLRLPFLQRFSKKTLDAQSAGVSLKLLSRPSNSAHLIMTNSAKGLIPQLARTTGTHYLTTSSVSCR